MDEEKELTDCILEQWEENKEELDLENMRLNLKTIRIVSNFLCSDMGRNIWFLYLFKNDLDAEAAITIAEILKSDHVLRVLDLHDNNITDNGAIAISESLRENKNLYSLKIGRNDIGHGGAMAMAETLRHNQTLRTLWLDYNEVGDKGAVALADALRMNHGLEALNLEMNKIEQAGLLALSQSLRSNQSLKILMLNQMNGSNQKCMSTIASDIRENQTLQCLYLENLDSQSNEYNFTWLKTKRNGFVQQQAKRVTLLYWIEKQKSWMLERKLLPFIFEYVEGKKTWWNEAFEESFKRAQSKCFESK